jgi:protein-L-isoaspartate(D-aspartate) O-methyltransferase
MVDSQIARRGIRDRRVLDAMRLVPREAFVDPDLEAYAYEDTPLPIGEKQTISQPFIVALMTEAAKVGSDDTVLEVGAGSGYAAAVLSRIAKSVYAIERHAPLADAARERIARIGYDNVTIRSGDGTKGWPEAAPLDAILVAAGGSEIPQALKAQLAVGGRLIMPVGEKSSQTLRKVTRLDDEAFQEADLGEVAFVPLVADSAEPSSRVSTRER